MEEPKYKRPTKSEQTSCTWCALSCSLKKRTVVIVFSRMRSKGSRFALGVWGLRVCSLDVAFMFATVRNRPQPFAWGPYGRACGKFCRRGHFWRFQTSHCFVSRGRRGTWWHSDVFVTCRKSFCVAGALLLRRFRKISCKFRGRRSTLDVSSVILRGRRSTSDVRIGLSGLRHVATRCKFRGRRGILWDAMKIDGSFARNMTFQPVW